MTERRPSRSLFVMYACAIAAGAAIICWSAIVFHTQNASFHWPTVSGTIVQSERVFVEGGRDSHYRADMTYNYKVNGKSYTSHRISLWSRDLSSYDSINGVFVKNHLPGTSVDVYYEPTRPEHAVLIPGPDETFIEFEMGSGALVMILAIPLIIRQIPRRRRMTELLNAPDAATRTMHLQSSDVQNGSNAFGRNVAVAFFFAVLAMGLLLSQWLDHPAVLLEKPNRMNPGMVIGGIGCLFGTAFFVRRAIKKGRSAECPLCRTYLNEAAVSASRCPGCGTRIVFGLENRQHVSGETKYD